MTFEQVRAQLNSVTYDNAIKYYIIQKQKFFNDYTKGLRNIGRINAKAYIQDFIDYINNSKFQQKSFFLTNQLIEKLNNSLIVAMENGSDVLKGLQVDYTKKYSDLTKRGKDQLAIALQQIFNLDIISNEIQDSLLMMGITGGIKIEDIQTQIESYLKAKMFNILKGNDKYYGNRAVIAGFFEEALVHNATSLLTKHLDHNLAGALQVGSTKINAGDRGNIESVFDEYFNFLSKDISASFESSINIDDNSLLNGYGAQIKLWNPPWKIQKPRTIYPITSNINLFNAWSEKRSWIKGVLYLENKVPQALGDNVMYILGNSFYWTYDLIQNFRDQQYYLAFNHNGEEFTQKIAWEQINMSKPNKKLTK